MKFGLTHQSRKLLVSWVDELSQISPTFIRISQFFGKNGRPNFFGLMS